MTPRPLPLLLLISLGCISTPEPQPPRAGAGVPWHGTFTKTNWLGEWQPRKQGTWGMDNLSVQEPKDGRFAKVLRAAFPKGSSSPAASRNESAPLGGGQFYGTLARPADHMFLRYFARFATGFDFVKGGKLPGLYGGTETSGGVSRMT